ncbi:MAG: lytic transglycosylase domain-containing protein [Deltaproteobacteria bacterium]|nr:MAG: lytic transglycosylase domain-containing protein [Deltaproteobacteria bacterium]
MRALVLASLLLAALPVVAALGGVARAETWACYDPQHPDNPPVFANGKKKGMRCVLFSGKQPWPKAAKPAATDATGGEKQDDAAGGQGGARTERFTPPRPPAGGTGDEPVSREGREDLYGPYIEEAARLYDLPEPFIKAIIRIESNFKYRALSPVGAQGLMQLMPVTAREMGVADPWDPRQNILGGARLLRLLANRHRGDIVKVLSSYCSGSGAVQKKGGIPNEAAEGYVRAVLDYYYQYKALDGP